MMAVTRVVQTPADSVQDTVEAVADSVVVVGQAADTVGGDFVSAVRGAADTLGLEVDVIIRQGGQVVVVLLLAWLAIRLLRSVTSRWAARFETPMGEEGSDADQRSRTLIQLLNSVGMIAIAFGAGLSILNLFVNIGPLLAGVGVLGLAVSFGAQNLVRDIISGFFILFENQYDLGDVVEINGVAGAVEKMTLRVVTVRDLQGVLHTIPNGTIQVVSNKTSGWSRAVLDIGVAYGEEIDRVISVLTELAAEFAVEGPWPARLLRPPEVLGVNELGDSAVLVRMLIQTKPGKQWEVKRELLRRIKNRFDELGIEIPFPQRTLHMRPPPGGS